MHVLRAPFCFNHFDIQAHTMGDDEKWGVSRLCCRPYASYLVNRIHRNLEL